MIFLTVGLGIFLQVFVGSALEILDYPACEEFQIAF
jgi:hypothetical protein